MRRFLVSLAVVLIPLSLAAQEAAKKGPSRAEAVALARTWLDAQRSYERIPGMSAAVVHDQQLLWSAGSGHADPVTKSPARPTRSTASARSRSSSRASRPCSCAIAASSSSTSRCLPICRGSP